LIDGKDHIHPFVSAAHILDIMRDLGAFTIDSDEQEESFKELKYLILNSKQKIPLAMLKGKNACKEIHCHRHLHAIFILLWSPNSCLSHIAPRGGFVDLVFRVCLFH